MSDKDNDKPSKNTAPEYRPKNAKSKADAPKGTSGILGTPASLDMGGPTKIVRMTVDVVVSDEIPFSQQPELTDAEKRAEYLKNLPQSTVFAPITGDEDIDNQSRKNGEVPVTKEEYESLKGAQKAEGPQISQSDYAKAFRRASGRTNEIYKGKSNEID